jgi:hypothetical protein
LIIGRTGTSTKIETHRVHASRQKGLGHFRRQCRIGIGFEAVQENDCWCCFE